MSAVLVGADRLGNIPELLEKMGIRVTNHISGRAASHQRQVAALPSSTDLLIVFTDFLNHNAMRSYRSRTVPRRPRCGLPAIVKLSSGSAAAAWARARAQGNAGHHVESERLTLILIVI